MCIGSSFAIVWYCVFVAGMDIDRYRGAETSKELGLNTTECMEQEALT